MDKISSIYELRKEFDKALKYKKEALKVRTFNLGNDHLDVGTTLFTMGIIFCGMEKYDEAIKCYETSLTIRKRKLGCSSIQVAQILHNLGSVHASLKEYK